MRALCHRRIKRKILKYFDILSDACSAWRWRDGANCRARHILPGRLQTINHKGPTSWRGRVPEPMLALDPDRCGPLLAHPFGETA
jgi:hypothetical protein